MSSNVMFIPPHFPPGAGPPGSSETARRFQDENRKGGSRFRIPPSSAGLWGRAGPRVFRAAPVIPPDSGHCNVHRLKLHPYPIRIVARLFPCVKVFCISPGQTGAPPVVRRALPTLAWEAAVCRLSTLRATAGAAEKSAPVKTVDMVDSVQKMRYTMNGKAAPQGRNLLDF